MKGREDAMYSVECLESGAWSEEIVGCEKMVCEEIVVDSESVDVESATHNGKHFCFVTDLGQAYSFCIV